MKSKSKAVFTRKATDNNGSIKTTIPKPVSRHLQLQTEEKIAVQKELNKEHGAYSSFWNHTKEGSETDDPYTATVTANGDSVQITIPKEVVAHLDLKPGDEIAFQAEYSEDHGAYASFWNYTNQEGGEE